MSSNRNDGEHLQLKVLGQNDNDAVIKFKIKKRTPLQKLMNSYCDKTGIDVSTARFRFDGHAICVTDTPASLNMVNNDTIEVYQAQIGGTIFQTNFD